MIRNLNKLINAQQLTAISRCYNTKAEQSTEYTHFGYETVETDKKTGKGDDFKIFQKVLL